MNVLRLASFVDDEQKVLPQFPTDAYSPEYNESALSHIASLFLKVPDKNLVVWKEGMGAETYSESCQTSKMERFAKTINSF